MKLCIKTESKLSPEAVTLDGHPVIWIYPDPKYSTMLVGAARDDIPENLAAAIENRINTIRVRTGKSYNEVWTFTPTL
jgi:hypothetical protein